MFLVWFFYHISDGFIACPQWMGFQMHHIPLELCCLFAAEEMEVEVGVWCGCYRFLSLPFLYFFIKVAGSERIKKHETDLMLIPSHEK